MMMDYILKKRERNSLAVILISAIALGITVIGNFRMSFLKDGDFENKNIIERVVEGKDMNKRKLTLEEERVLIHKGTELPFSGKYWNFKGVGIYLCKLCGKPLYRSLYKFESHCGWPSFDDALQGAVKEIPDIDGVRQEIVCANCGAHLGHIFYGEHLTAKDVRHCVNSISLEFKGIKSNNERDLGIAYFAGGCFWGVEYYFQKEEGVLSTRVGYMGGDKRFPTYKDVCADDTGHAETVEVIYDASVVSYEKLAKLFFEIHDPTQLNRQGPDIGSQYRSVIFYTNDEQKRVAERLIEQLKEKGYNVVTEVEEAGEFWLAEPYHQDYYEKKGEHPYCHRPVKRFD